MRAIPRGINLVHYKRSAYMISTFLKNTVKHQQVSRMLNPSVPYFSTKSLQFLQWAFLLRVSNTALEGSAIIFVEVYGFSENRPFCVDIQKSR
jgi:chloramphenicol O-acetyltransferase